MYVGLGENIAHIVEKYFGKQDFPLVTFLTFDLGEHL
jgi:hypothetical protein